MQTKWNGVDYTQGGDVQDWFGTRLWSQFGGRPERTNSGCAIKISSLKIRLGWPGFWRQLYKHPRKSNLGIGVLQETKLTKVIYKRYISGYKVWAMEAESRHRGGITII